MSNMCQIIRHISNVIFLSAVRSWDSRNLFRNG